MGLLKDTGKRYYYLEKIYLAGNFSLRPSWIFEIRDLHLKLLKFLYFWSNIVICLLGKLDIKGLDIEVN